MLRMTRQAGIVHGGDFGMRGQELGERLGVGVLARDAQREGLQTAYEQVSGQRVDDRPGDRLQGPWPKGARDRIFLLEGVWPTFYADVTHIFMSSHQARGMVDLAGPMVTVVSGSVVFIGAYGWQPGVGQSLLFGAGIVL